MHAGQGAAVQVSVGVNIRGGMGASGGSD